MSEQLKPAIVRIFNTSDDIVGGGFLVSDSHIITCAHVVNLARRRSKSNTDKPAGEIALGFPLIASDQKLKAEVIEWFPPEEFHNLSGKPQDIAVLKLKDNLPARCAAAQLVFGNNLWKHDCRAFGFAKSQGRWVPVVARDEVAGRWIQVESGETEYALEPGFSGTAVWDDQLNGVVGMVIAGEARQEERAKFESPDLAGELISHRKLPGAFLIPTAVLAEAWPELRDRIRPPRPAINLAEPPPDDFVARPAEFNKLLKHLLDPEREKPVAIGATALRGAGGYGKTTLAKAVCHDTQIQSSFKDGILWVTIGETPGNLAAKLDDLTYALNGKKPGSESIEAAVTEFKKHLEGREILIVIDDVWSPENLRPFLQGGQRCARLITTRLQNVIPTNAHKVEVDAMRIGEAVELLAAGFENDTDHPVLGDDLSKLASTLGEWPLLLKLANGALRNRVENGDSFRDALDFIKADLEENGLTAFDSQDEEERSRAVSVTLGVSFRLLKDTDLARFNELAVFPEDVDIPLSTVEKFWSATGILSRVNSQKLCERLHSLSLLLNFSLKEKRIRLHDVIRKYLIEQQRDRLPEIHAQMLDSHQSSSTTKWSELPDDEPYLWDHLAFHLIGAGRGDELVATVKDWRYLAKKTLLRKSPSVENDLILADALAPEDDPLRALRRGFAGASHIFNHCVNRRDIESTLLARLRHLNELKPMVQEMAQILARPYVTPQSSLPDIPHPALIRTLEGHSSPVLGCAFSPDNKLIASVSEDGTLKIWDVRTAEVIHTLEGHSDWTIGCAFSPDGKLSVSASDDRTLKIWDTRAGNQIRTLVGHSYSVLDCAFSPDGIMIVSASLDHTLKVWDAWTGEALYTLEGHSSPVSGCAFSPDGKMIVSASDDCTLKIWDARTGDLIRTLVGHSYSVRDCAFSPDSKIIVSASDDCTLKVWDSWKGQALHMPSGHYESVNDCAFSPNGNLIVSASSDLTLRVWDARTGDLIHTFEGHSGSLAGCAFSPDGKLIASASIDRTLKVWDAESGRMLRTIVGHSSSVLGCAFSPDGKMIVSASLDRTLKVWDAETGRMLRTLVGHSISVLDCAFSPDGKTIVSASLDRTLKVWDSWKGQALHMPSGHYQSVNACAFSPTGKLIVSASDDSTLKVWDAKNGFLIRTLVGHSDSVGGCAFSPDGKLIISASDDRTLKVWATESGKCVATFYADGPLYCCAFSSDNVLIVAGGARGVYFLKLER